MKIKVFLTVLLLQVVTFVDSAYNGNDKDLKSVISEADLKLTIATGLMLSLVDFMACLYIIVRTHLQWKQYEKRTIPMSFRFPFYIASIEIWVSFFQIINWSNSAAASKGQFLCSLIGLFSTFFIGFASNLVTIVTLVTWYKTKNNTKFNYGRFDYILFLSSSVISLFYTLLGIGDYGQVEFWCSIQPRSKSVLHMILIIIIVHILLLLVFYINMHIIMKRGRTNSLSFNEQDLQENSNKRIITKKIISYTSAFSFRLLLLMIYIIVGAANAKNPAIDIFGVLGISIGGLLIALQYIINEGWKHHKPDIPVPVSSLNSISQINSQANVLSLRNSIRQLPLPLPFTRIQVEIVQQQIIHEVRSI